MSRVRPRVRNATLALVVPLLGCLLPACPPGPIGGNATITLNNDSLNTTITRIRMIAPGEAAPGNNILSGQVTAGNSVDITVSAPTAEDAPEGARWTVILNGQLNVRVKQDDPDDLRVQLNANFDTVDTSDNEELTLEEVTAAYPAATPFQFAVLDADNSGAIARGEVGSLLRVAYGTFTCVREGDAITWNFDGQSIGEYCGDTP